MSTPATPTPHHGLPGDARPALSGRSPAALPSGSPAAWLLLLVPALVFVAEPFFVAHDSVGRGNSFRDAPFALIVGLAGLWMAVTVGRHVLSAALAGIAGVGLVFDAILAPHEYVGVTVTEAVCGVFAVVVAAIAAAQSASSSSPSS